LILSRSKRDQIGLRIGQRLGQLDDIAQQRGDVVEQGKQAGSGHDRTPGNEAEDPGAPR